MLAVRYDMSMAALRTANNLSSDELKVGQQLKIPSADLAGEP
jgi:N-acetylmuramoyl-L-alanine amidase